MEISEHEFRRMIAEADEHHRLGMQTLEADLAEIHLGEGRDLHRTSRRQLLRRVGAGGAAIAVGTAVVPFLDLFTPAAAQTDEVPTDAAIVAFAESVELALSAAYLHAATLGTASSAAVKSALTLFAGHHQQHAVAFAGVGRGMSVPSTHKANPKLLDIAVGQFDAARDQDHVLSVGFLIETSAAASYMVALGTLKNAAAQKLSASVLPVESQHSVVFGAAQGKPIAELVPTFILPDHALDASKYPLAT